MNLDCTRALDHLKNALEAGTSFDPEVLAHLEACPACRANLSAALKGLEPADEFAPTVDPEMAEVEVRTHHRRRLLWRSLALGAVLATACFGLLAYRGLIRDEPILLVAIVLGMVFWIVLAIWVVRIPARIGLYKRLGQGRQLSGVCLGLAQRTRTPVWMWRLGFVLLTLFNGAGFGPYILLSLVMPVHPDDRPHLLRFRLARWWRGRRVKTA